MSNVPTCSFKNGSLGGLSTILVNAGGEQLTLYEEYDTVVLINVLEHVQVDIFKQLLIFRISSGS